MIDMATITTWPCTHCGATVEHWRGESDAQCASCDTWYNAFGQRLRNDWQDNLSNYDDSLSDLDGYEREMDI